jgi:hypothetical protein
MIWFTIMLVVWVITNGAAAFANNVAIANVKLVSRSTSAGTVAIQFDLSWNNAWKDSVNNDAVWMFFKYSSDAGTSWGHATMKTSGTNPSGVSTGTKSSGAFNALDVIVTNDKKGAFIQPRYLGSGTVNFTSLQLIWNYKQDGFSDAAMLDATNTKIRAFAIEMVCIPQGGFYLGDNSDGSLGQFEWGGSSASKAGVINSETEPLSFGTAATQWYYNTDTGASNDNASGDAFEVSSSFPKGYQAFYLMKYKITEGQWVGFFNTLTSAQKTTRDITSSTNSGKNSDSTVSRNTISWSSGDATTSRTDRECSYLAWADVASYCDWAALRPMSELEYEKAGRGPLSPVTNEYPWGSTSVTVAATISGTENGTETITTSSANIVRNNTTFSGGDASSGPVRAGIFATSTSTTRLLSGAGYYGNMQLAGNLWERVVSVGNSIGRGFSGSHGDGLLTLTTSYEGNADNPDWPGMDTTDPTRGITATSASGVGRRGGAWNDVTATDSYLSSRSYGCSADAGRSSAYGGRAARTANS